LSRSLNLVERTDWSVRPFSYADVELASLNNEEVVSRFEDSTLHGDTASSVDVVSRHHSYRYARPLTLANCVRHLQTRTRITLCTPRLLTTSLQTTLVAG